MSTMEQQGNNSALLAPPVDDGKKKQAPYLEREVKVKNPGNVDHVQLFNSMHDRFVTAEQKWKQQAKKFKAANLAVTIVVICLQLTQVIIFQLPAVDNQLKNAMATILPTVTGAILALQLKLAWSEKGVKCKKAARIYSKLVHHMEYRIHLTQAGGSVVENDSVKLWNTALLSETKDVPTFLTCC